MVVRCAVSVIAMIDLRSDLIDPVFVFIAEIQNLGSRLSVTRVTMSADILIAD
jgi:hypothetical protein